MTAYPVIALAARSGVLDDDEVLARRDEGGLPELSAQVNPDDLRLGIAQQQYKEERREDLHSI